MDIFTEYENLLNSAVFRQFMNSDKEYYLVHIYQMSGKEDSTSLEFGFYNQSTDKIVVFETNPVGKREEEEVFKEADTIYPLNLETVKITMDSAIDIADQTCKIKYPSEIIHKRIVLLQNLGQQVWNMTLISLSFNIINIKIDSETGEVIDSSIHSIMGLGNRI